MKTNTVNRFHKCCELGLEDYILKNGGMYVSGKNGRFFIRGKVKRAESRINSTSMYKCDLVFISENGEKYFIEVINTNQLTKRKKEAYIDSGFKYVVFVVSDLGSYLSKHDARKAAMKSAEIYGLNFLY